MNYADDDDELMSVPSPEDDTSDITRTAIQNMIRKYEPQLLQLANDLGLDIGQEDEYNAIVRVIGHCFRNNFYFGVIGGLQGNENTTDNLTDFIKQLKRLNTRDPTKVMHFQNLCNHIGMIYRAEWLALSKK